MSQTKDFASQADLEEKKVTFSTALRARLGLHRRGRPEHRHRHRRRRGAGGRHAGHAGDGGRRDPPHPRGHRQADQVRGAHATTTRCACSAPAPTSRSTSSPARTRYDLIVERGEQDKASEIGRFPRLFRNVEIGAAGHDLADHDLHRQDDAVAGQARGAAAAARPRPHQGRHGGLAAAGAHAVLAATWSSSTPRRTPATPTSRTGRRRSTTSPR